MSDGLAISEISMLNDLLTLQTISHNLANVSTPGFKQQITSSQGFEQELLVNQAMGIQGSATGGIQVMVPEIKNSTDTHSGSVKYTGMPLDIAMTDNVYLAVRAKNSEVYTRQGDLHLNSQGRLVTAKGLEVVGVNGDIQLTTDKPVIDQQGRILINGNVVAGLKLVRLAAEGEIQTIGDGLYKSATAVEVVENENVVNQGYIEASNVDMTAQMIKMIELNRHFESTQRVIRGYDDMLDNAINIIGEF